MTSMTMLSELRHDLPVINILTLDGHINKNGTELYEGLDRFDARKKIIEDLKEQKYLDKIKKHKLKVPRGDRTNSIIEPMLTDQWYVSMTKSNGSNGKSIAQEALDLVEQGEIKFYPNNWVNTYNQWLEKYSGLVYIKATLVGTPNTSLVWRKSRGFCSSFI